MSNNYTMKELARLSELIDSIYQGATNPEHWNVVIPQIAEWVGSPRGLLLTPLNPPDKGGFYFNHSVSESYMQLYTTKYMPSDVWALRAVEKRLAIEGNVVISDDDLITFDELQQTEFYQDFLSKHDTAHLMSGIVFGVGSPEYLPWTVLTLHRGLNEGAFGPIERERMKLIIPHLSRSVGVMFRLRSMELRIASSQSALDQLSSGVLLFDESGAVVFANRAAKRIFDEEDGLKLRQHIGNTSLGEVQADSHRVQADINRAIRSSVTPTIMEIAHFSRAVMVPRPSGRQDYMLNFSSLAAQNEFGFGAGAPRVIAFITDHAEPIRLDAELLRRTYGLTPAEIRAAESVAEGLTLEEVAEKLCVSRATIKTQLQQVYEKTNTNNRAKLMRLLMSLSQMGN